MHSQYMSLYLYKNLTIYLLKNNKNIDLQRNHHMLLSDQHMSI